MTNADSVKTSNQNNDLMNADSTNNVEDNDPVPKNITPTIRNPCITTILPPV